MATRTAQLLAQRTAADAKQAALKQQLDKTRANITDVERDLERLQKAYKLLDKRIGDQGNEAVRKLAREVEQVKAQILEVQKDNDQKAADTMRRIKSKEQDIAGAERQIQSLAARLQEDTKAAEAAYRDSDVVLLNARSVIEVLRDKLRNGLDVLGPTRIGLELQL